MAHPYFSSDMYYVALRVRVSKIENQCLGSGDQFSDDFDGGVDEGEVAGGAGHGGVEPAEEVDGRVGFGGYVAHVDEYGGPLAALGFVAGDGISEFYLKGVVEGVGFQYLPYGRGGGVFADACIPQSLPVEPFALFVGEAGCVAAEGVEVEFSVHAPVVVGEVQPYVGKRADGVRLDGKYLFDHTGVAVGYEIHGAPRFTLAVDVAAGGFHDRRTRPVIVVFGDYESLAGAEFFLAVVDYFADGEVEVGGAAVGARNQQGVFFAEFGKRPPEYFLKILRLDYGHILKTGNFDFRLYEFARPQCAPQLGGVVEDSRTRLLAHGLGDGGAHHVHPLCFKHFGIHCRRFLHPYRRKLGRVAKKNQLAV